MAQHPEYAQWRDLAAKELRGKAPESLNWQTPEGIVVKPLYTEADLEAIAAAGSPWRDAVPGGDSDSSQLVGGEDSELTTKTMILRTWSSGVGCPASCRRNCAASPAPASVTDTARGALRSSASTATA